MVVHHNRRKGGGREKSTLYFERKHNITDTFPYVWTQARCFVFVGGCKKKKLVIPPARPSLATHCPPVLRWCGDRCRTSPAAHCLVGAAASGSSTHNPPSALHGDDLRASALGAPWPCSLSQVLPYHATHPHTHTPSQDTRLRLSRHVALSAPGRCLLTPSLL